MEEKEFQEKRSIILNEFEEEIKENQTSVLFESEIAPPATGTFRVTN